MAFYPIENMRAERSSGGHPQLKYRRINTARLLLLPNTIFSFLFERSPACGSIVGQGASKIERLKFGK
jgi:hypothetical protein